jgi:TetR/AcrR family transcriptional regulator, transcriptional repressor for nem operon
MPAARAEIPRQTRRTDTGERLVRIGTEFLSEKGFGLTGLDEVLRAADVPKGSFYYYFDSKIDFGLAVIDNYAGIWERKLKRLLENPSVPPLRRIDDYIAEGISGLERYAFQRGCLIGNMGQEITTLNDAIRDRLLGVFAHWTKAMAACLAEAKKCGDIDASLDVGKMSRFFWLAWEGAVLQAKLQRSTQPIEDFRDVLFRQILVSPGLKGAALTKPRGGAPRSQKKATR